MDQTILWSMKKSHHSILAANWLVGFCGKTHVIQTEKDQMRGQHGTGVYSY